MRSKASLLPSRRTRAGRIVRRVFLLLVVLIGVSVLYVVYVLFISSGYEQLTPFQTKKAGTDPQHGQHQDKNNHDGAGNDAMPYSENLDELLQLLRIYAAARGVTVNTTVLSTQQQQEGRDPGTVQGEGTVAAEKLPENLLLNGVHLLRSDEKADEAGLRAHWVLDDPATIQAEQEGYVERYLTPVHADTVATPLQMLAAYYSSGSAHSLSHRAAAVEKAMNDDGYAKYVHRSPTFFDPSHAARRGYGSEGSIFVAVPFTLADITPDMVDAIRERAKAAEASRAAADAAAGGGDGGKGGPLPTASPVLRSPLDGTDDATASVDVDGFREIQRTAVHCAMTVESVFRNAHHSVAVTVGTIDVVVVSGVQSQAEAMDFDKPNDVRIPITAEERLTLTLTRHRRYDRITCEPPDFRSGWEDASYGFSWKDNFQQRRVLVPLTQLLSPARDAAAATTTTETRVSPSLLPLLGRYAVMQLYRGQSYMLLLRPGSLALRDWDLKLRLLYLRTPEHSRAVLSSRPTPAATLQSTAAALLRQWATHPALHYAGPPSVAAQEAAARHANGVPPTAVGDGAAAQVDVMGRRLLRALPSDVSAWLSAAQGDSALSLWLVTPQWLWPAVVSAVAEMRDAAPTAAAAAAAATMASSAPLPRVQPSLSALFSADVLRDVLDPATAAAIARLDVASVVATPVGAAAGDATRGGKAAGRMLHVRGGGSSGTATPQAVVATSLSEADVYRLLFLTEKRAPLPDEAITDMSKLMQGNRTASGAAQANTDAAKEAAAAAAAGTAQWRPEDDWFLRTAGVVCGIAGTSLPLYSTADAALVKRSFEFCWLYRHRAALRGVANRFVESTYATTLLKTSSPSSVVAAAPLQAAEQAGQENVEGEEKAVACGPADGEEESGTMRWYEVALMTHNTSQCLSDMRYLDPADVPLTVVESSVAAAAAATTPEAKAAWFMHRAHAGQLRGTSNYNARPTAEQIVEAAQAPSPLPESITPYILQSVATADFLFAPAEAFFDFLPEDRLRTRGRTLPEQLADLRRARERKFNTAAAGSVDSAYAEVPEPVVLDPTLQYLDDGATDLYLTAALWTRGWNVFGVTEAVVGGNANPTKAATTIPTTAAAAGGGGNGEGVANATRARPSVCALKPEREEKKEEKELMGVAPEVAAAQRFTREKLWALVELHMKQGTPFGPAMAPMTETGGEALTKARFPLRRTLQEYEAFSGLKLSSVKEKALKEKK